ncbi:MAG: cysteine--tRNA ligase [Armatimonadetes bacterium]|nr:cysteine--tRNA ligase [Armatimonadota bacterium]
MSRRVFKLYDTMTKQVKELQTSEPGHLRFYTCGPTVYSYAHIGNFRSFLGADLVVRTARSLDWRVTWVTNVTDVGHLTQDDVADAGGEDRMERALRSKEGEHFANVWDLAEYYTQCYIEDWERLNLSEPHVRPRATQHVREQILMAEQLVSDGHAYETPTGVYFDVDSFQGYGKLSGNTRDKLMEAVREVVVDDNKRKQADFALWKKDDKHLMQWFSPWGWGFPGWHIECSAMARVYLGDTLDLHSGGEDNAFPHHECEIAQSEAVTGRPFANHWMHVRYLQVEGEKMAKRTGNFYTVRDLVERGFDPLALRYALISVPYGKPFNFTLQVLKDAQGNVERFRECVRRVEARLPRFVESTLGAPGPEHPLDALYGQALDAMCDDLNTSVAISKAVEGAKWILRQPGLSDADALAAGWFLKAVNGLLGIAYPERHAGAHEGTREEAEPTVQGRTVSEWIEARTAAKRSKDFIESDRIRDVLSSEGIELRDAPEGTTWIRRPFSRASGGD